MVGTAARSQPQTDEATPSALFQAGREAFSRGEFRTAAERFEAAYRASPHEAALYNAGVAWSSAGELARAADDLELALDTHRQDPAPYLDDAGERLGELKRMLGYLKVAAPLGWTVSVAHVVQAAIPTRLHVAPGKWTVTFSSGRGAPTRRDVVLHAGEVLTLGIPAAVTINGEEGAELARTHAREVKRERRTAGFALLGSATLFAAAGVVVGLEAFSARDRFYASGLTDKVAHDQAATLRTLANVAWGVSGAAALVSVSLFVASAAVKEPSPVALALRLGPTSATVTGAF